MKYMKENTLTPMAGHVIVKPYVKDTTLKSSREEPGEPQKSEVIAIGDFYLDDHGNTRECPVKIGDIIVHRYATETIEVDYEEYRIVPFYQILAKLG